ASGALRGEELNSVLEQTPRLAEAIAAGMGIPFGQLRALAAEGRITADAIIRALIDQSDVLQGEFDRMPTTIGQALTKIENGWLRYIGQTNEAVGASENIADALGAVGDHLEEIADTTVRVGGVVAT